MFRFASVILIMIITTTLSSASDYNPKVEILQRNLILLNYNPGPTDGLWGGKTKKSYHLFLNENDLPIPENPKSFSTNDLNNIRLEKISENLKTFDHLNKPLTVRDAAHLLRRTGFGAHPNEVKELLHLTRADGIIHILKGMQQQQKLSPPEFTKGKIPPHFMGWSIDGFEEIMEGHRDQLKSWWLNKMITTSNPQLEKLTLFWHNHFVSSYEGVDRANFALYWQNQKFREYGLSNFKLLTKLMLSDTALLKYLDNDENEKEAPNENLARELLELFTLGEGNYSEKTIKQAARTLTGFTFNEINGKPFFDKYDHDFGQKTIFGKTGNFKPHDLVDIIFEQPTASIFLTSKLWKLYISELNPPNEELNVIASNFKESDYDLLILVSELLASQSFWEEKNRGTIIKSPIDLLVGTTRSTGHITNLDHLLPEKVASLGQDLFEHPNVAGWPGGADWINSTRLLGRQQEINYFVKSFEESGELKSEVKMETKKTSNEMNKKNEVLEPISLEEISFFASVWSQSFIKGSKEAGMQISLASPQFKDHYSTILSFGLGYNLIDDEVHFCFKSPGSISYFYEEYAHFIENGGINKGFCYSTNWFDENEFLKIIQSMNTEDLLRVNFVCRFLGSQKRKDWFETGIAKPDFGVGSFGLEKIVELWQSEQTIKKINDLSRRCNYVTDLLIKSKNQDDSNIKEANIKQSFSRIGLQDINFFSASIWSSSFIWDEKEGGMNINLFSPKFSNHYSPIVNFNFGYNLDEKSVHFGIKSQQTVSYFYEDFAHWSENSNTTLGFAYNTDWFNENEFLKIIQSMNKDDVARLELVCKFIGSQKRKDWFNSGKIKLGHEKAENFWRNSETVNKIEALSEKCLKVIDFHIESLMQPTLSVEKKQVTETYASNELVLDTARFRWINKKRKGKDYLDLSIGLNDLTFNKIKKSGMHFHFNISLRKKEVNTKRYRLAFENKDCDNGCFSKSDTNPNVHKWWGIYFPPNKSKKDGFFSLNKEDKKFAAALWLALPELLDHAQLVAGEHIQEEHLPNLKAWEKELNEFRKLALKSLYKKYVPDFKLTIKEEDYPNSNIMDSNMMSNMMVPKEVELNDEIASNNVDDYLSKIEDLNISRGKELSDLLLSIQPVTNQSKNVSIGSLLKDPAFQLN